MKVVVVDDERVALENIKSLIPWEQHGFEIVGTATNGKSALKLYEERRPQIMIVDIRMPIMDGLELIQTLAARRDNVKFIVMSAYEDFEYARQSISCGNVSCYLLKHEADGERLLDELLKAKKAWQEEDAKRRLELADRLKSAVLGGHFGNSDDANGIRGKLGMLLIQPDMPFSIVPSPNLPFEFADGWLIGEDAGTGGGQDWEPVGSFMLNADQLVMIFANKSLVHSPGETFRSIAADILNRMSGQFQRSFSCFYTVQAGEKSVQQMMQLLTEASSYRVFCGKNAIVCADDLPILAPKEPMAFKPPAIRLDELMQGLKLRNHEMIEHGINQIFSGICEPVWDLPGLYEAVHLCAKLYQDYWASSGMMDAEPLRSLLPGEVYHVQEIRQGLIQAFRDLIAQRVPQTLSPKLNQAIRYMNEHYMEDIGIDEVADAVGISVSYLHQLFKKDLNRTFLDCLTEIRIRKAQHILLHEDAKMFEVSERVGYRSPQHFSQVFKRMTGMSPHEFREGRLS